MIQQAAWYRRAHDDDDDDDDDDAGTLSNGCEESSEVHWSAVNIRFEARLSRTKQKHAKALITPRMTQDLSIYCTSGPINSGTWRCCPSNTSSSSCPCGVKCSRNFSNKDWKPGSQLGVIRVDTAQWPDDAKGHVIHAVSLSFPSEIAIGKMALWSHKSI